MRPHEFLSDVAATVLKEADAGLPDLHWHPDMGLPDTLDVNEKTLRRLCIAMGRWGVRIGSGGITAIGIWRGWPALGDRADSIVIEVGRRARETEATTTVPEDSDLAAIRAAALAAGGASPLAVVADRTERISVSIPDVLEPDVSMSRPWGNAFDRHRILFIRSPVLTPARLERSMSLSALVARYEPDREAALRLMQSSYEAGEPFDFIGLSYNTFGNDLMSLIERLRGTRGGEQLRIVVTGAPVGLRTMPGVDAVVAADGRAERLFDAIFDLIRRPHGAEAGSIEEVPSMIGRHIMVVEDVAMNRALLEAMLAPTGATLSLVADGRAAIAQSQQRPADVVLMDIQLPGMDGLEVTRRLRAISPRSRVVALTAHARLSDRARYLAAGMDDYLAKPIRVDDLYATLRRAVS
ncbi:MAG: response regulator [Pseudomonadota bacterium]